MYGCHDCKHKFKLVNGSGNVAIEAKAENFEQNFKVIKNRKSKFNPLLKFEEMLSRLLVWSVLETYTCSDKCIAQSNQDDKDMVQWTLQELCAKSWCHTTVSVLMHCHQLPSFIIAFQNLSFACQLSIGLPVNPHFLKLDPNLIESFCDDSNKYILDHPSQKENHGSEIQGGFPVLC